MRNSEDLHIIMGCMPLLHLACPCKYNYLAHHSLVFSPSKGSRSFDGVHSFGMDAPLVHSSAPHTVVLVLSAQVILKPIPRHREQGDIRVPVVYLTKQRMY